MRTTGKLLVSVVVIFVAVVITGCGSSSNSTTASSSGASSPAPTTTGEANTTAPAPTPASEAQSTAQGDIPDNQVFLTYKNPAAGYSIKYPEGWARRGSGNGVTFQDKSNIVQITVAPGALPKDGAKVSLPAGPAVKTTFNKPGPPDPVTGKKLTLMVDRYVFARGGNVATVDLATPVGVDNVDAYRMMSESFRWL